ncbi:MAG: conjugal transfer protein TraD [Rickettsia endosymbiont of Ixodes persulcatus]|nr:conjugal transfer protein TraD [Rickettsia endosymbiont of Ixodes persulcatus]
MKNNLQSIAMQLQKAISFDRKSDARKKIMLGGLFVKVGLDYFHPDNSFKTG